MLQAEARMENTIGDEERRIAPESNQTKRVREKLKQQWAEEALLITDNALSDTVKKIHDWIALNACHRVVLKNKEIRLFDQNKNAASLSRKVQELAKKIS